MIWKLTVTYPSGGGSAMHTYDDPVAAFTHGYSNYNLRELAARPDFLGVTLALDHVIVELTPEIQMGGAT
jgi:hypothetical protein